MNRIATGLLHDASEFAGVFCGNIRDAVAVGVRKGLDVLENALPFFQLLNAGQGRVAVNERG
ncbi:MAG: hypothetical protein BWX45_00961 [Deltaproteobacteria bacterium ADurb.Bin002]|nr:MAG: hypothetical protein BWX45_00961 [Deltaproteobacteria bacterium ADurb.Bin002]